MVTSRFLAAVPLASLLAATAMAQVPAAPPAAPADVVPESFPNFLDVPPLTPIEIAPPLPPPPPPDPALAAPLPPLGAAILAPAAAEAEPPPPPDIPYRVTLEGFGDTGLEDRFRDVSALLSDGRRAGNRLQVRARAEQDEATAARLLRSEGWFDAAATAVVGEADGGTLPVTLTLTPGRRYRLGSITITGAPPEPAAIARAALEIDPGEPIAAPVIQSAEARVLLRLPEQGYPFPALGQRDILLDEEAFTGDYTLPVTPGRKARFGALRLAGDPVFGQRHAERLRRFREGDVYDSRKVDDLRQAMLATGLFASAAAQPVATGSVDADGVETVDLELTQQAGPPRTLGAQVGFATGEGLRLSGQWQHRNLFPPEGALIVGAVAGTNEQSVNTQFRRNNAGQRDRILLLMASAARRRFQAFDAETFNLSGSFARVSTPIWQKRWTWSAGAELLASRERAFDPERAQREAGTYLIAALPLQLGYDRSNDLLDPTRGFRLTARISPEAQKRLGEDFDAYTRTLIEASGYYPVSDALVIAGRARLGSIVGTGRDTIAPSRRLYAGGGGSVRGFGFQELGPRGANNEPLGGRGLTEFALEARYRFGNFGIVPFIDAGRLGEGSAPSLAGMRVGVGIGARYYTNFGPMRIDIATPLGRRPGESRVALYISIGQAF